jgi:hypothetical protein
MPLGSFLLDWLFANRASVMLDVVFVAMFLVLPVLGWSIWQVRYRQRYVLHKRVQLALGAVLLVAVTAFEVDMQVFHDWEELAVPAGSTGPPPAHVYYALYVHLFFAVTSAVLWVWVIVQALRKYPSPPVPGPHSRQHVPLARLAAIDMALTAITGWVFYWLAFVD